MKDGSFAPPASKLGQSGIGNTVQPAGGQGLTLNPLGIVPLGALPILASLPAGGITTSSTTYVDITNGPSFFIKNSGNYLIIFGARCQLQVAAITDMYIVTHGSISGNGSNEAITTQNDQFEGVATASYDFRALIQGESLSLQVKNGAANSVQYDRAWLVAILHRPDST